MPKKTPLYSSQESIPFVTEERASALLKCLKYFNEDSEVEPNDAEYEHLELFMISLEKKLARTEQMTLVRR